MYADANAPVPLAAVQGAAGSPLSELTFDSLVAARIVLTSRPFFDVVHIVAHEV